MHRTLNARSARFWTRTRGLAAVAAVGCSLALASVSLAQDAPATPPDPVAPAEPVAPVAPIPDTPVPVAPGTATPTPAPATPAPAATKPALPTFPEPSTFPISWELKIKHSTPERIVVRVAGEAAPKAYWYLTYTVTNLGDQDVEFDPVFEMLAENGKTYRANVGIPNAVFEVIKKKEGDSLLESPRQVIGTIHPGEDQAKDSVAIFPEMTRRMGTFSIFASGFSGEAVTMKRTSKGFVVVNPNNAVEELKGVKEEDRMLLTKQYQVTYRVLGDADRPGNDPVEQRGRGHWVMR